MYNRFVSNSPRKERVEVIKATYPNKTIQIKQSIIEYVNHIISIFFSY